MAYDPGALDATLAAALGDEPRLIAELRGAFLEGAAQHLAALRAAVSLDDWRNAATRMRSLAASFGATRLMDAASDLLANERMTVTALRRIERSIAALAN